MCGIFCEILTLSQSRLQLETNQKLKSFLNTRGPDYFKCVTHCVDSKILTFYGTTLWMQGKSITPQPLETDYGCLLYNGDIFDTTWSKQKSDTKQIIERLHCCCEDDDSRRNHILKILTSLKGPYSIVYFDKLLKALFLCRDAIGRNSLLFFRDDNSIMISSVLGRSYETTVDVPASHIFILNLKDQIISSYCRESLSKSHTLFVDSWHSELLEKQTIPDELYRHDNSDFVPPTEEDLAFIKEVESVATKCKTEHEAMEKLLLNPLLSSTVNQLTILLKASIRVRLIAQPFRCKQCINTQKSCSHCTVGVLFSGGLDCSILAVLADECLPKEQPIDLINVAFGADSQARFDAPDRLTGRASFKELKLLRPHRQWRLLEVNVTENELRRAQRDVIADLVHPRRTVLDESLGSALWFAARGAVGDSTSMCRLVVLGSGADELFGGYTRHRNALKRHSWRGLHAELTLDWSRISQRNLARDNRVICHHGRQPRLPYLDEDFTRYVLQLKPWLRCVPSDACGPGLGDKLTLRLLAHRLGLSKISALPKRALQFGSRIANKKERGGDISERFQNIHVQED